MKTILDLSGKILYSVHPNGTVTDKNSRFIGRVCNGCTTDSSGNLVARTEAPGLLLR